MDASLIEARNILKSFVEACHANFGAEPSHMPKEFRKPYRDASAMLKERGLDEVVARGFNAQEQSKHSSLLVEIFDLVNQK